MAPNEINFVRQTCQAARDLGIGIREDKPHDLVGYTWRLPSGETLRSGLLKTRQTALLAACRSLANHLAAL